MKSYFAVALFVSFIFVADAQLPFGRRGLGGNLGITTCPSRTNPSATIPASFDAREKWPDCIQPIRDQGGYIDVAMNYIIDTGIVGDSCYPYEGTQTSCGAAQCLNGTSSNNQKFKNKNCYKLDGIANIQYDIMTYGPIVAGYTVYEDFFSYTSGVYIKNSDQSAGGHAVKIIGWGTENGVDYWLVANSWTANWGEQGYFKIRRGTNECSIEDNMVGGEADLTSVSAQYEQYPGSATPLVSPATSPASSMTPSFSPASKTLASSAFSLLKIWSVIVLSVTFLLF